MRAKCIQAYMRVSSLYLIRQTRIIIVFYVFLFGFFKRPKIKKIYKIYINRLYLYRSLYRWNSAALLSSFPYRYAFIFKSII